MVKKTTANQGESFCYVRKNFLVVHRTPANYRVMPWANGSGSTTEVAVFPRNTTLSDASALWRISMAKVTEDGPFSLLPDYERIITVVEGNGFHLTGDHATNTNITQGSAYHFSGAEAIQCHLVDGPCLDLNVIYKKNSVRKASLELFGYGEFSPLAISIEPCAGEIIVLVNLEGCVRIQLDKRKGYRLNPRDSLHIHFGRVPREMKISRDDTSRIALVRILMS